MPRVPSALIEHAWRTAGAVAPAFVWAAMLNGPPCLEGAPVEVGPSRTGSVVGKVIDGRAGAPLAGATVRLLWVRGPFPAESGLGGTMPSGTSGEAGTFEFPGIPAGDYEIHAGHPGYLDAGTRAVPQTVTVLPGQRTTSPAVELHPESAIRGQVLDASGTGVAGTRVRAFAARRGRLLEVGSGKTGKSGAFIIGQIPAGSYILLAAPPTPSRAPTYHPSSPTFDEAVPIDVREAEHVSGIRITLAPDPVHRVRGTVEDIRGVLGHRSASAYLVPSSARGMDLAALAWKAPLDSFRRFEFHGVASGQHTVQLLGDSPEHRILATQAVIVGSSDVNDLKIYPEQPLALRGRVWISGLAPRDLSNVRISLHADPSAAGFSRSIDALAGSAGHFVAESLEPTSYTFLVQVPPGLFVEKVRFGGRNITDQTLNLAAGVAGSSLEIKLRDGAARLSGAVLTTGSSDQRRKRMRVAVLFPAAAGPGAMHRSISPATEDRFEFDGIAPGKYKVFATDRFDPALFEDPTFLGLVSGRVRTVELGRHARSRVDVQLIDAPRVEAASRRAGLAGF